MAAKAISDQDKARVRDLTEEAISLGKSAGELAQIREALCTELKAGRRSLGSVSAYVEYSATQALAGEEVASGIGNRDLITVARLLRESPTRGEDLVVLATDLGVGPLELDRLVNRYDSLLRGRPGGIDPLEEAAGTGGGPPVSAPALEADPGELSELVCDAGPAGGVEEPIAVEGDPQQKSISVRGDTADYDFLEKQVWRALWAAFIHDSFPHSHLRRAKVICLPGREVEPEVSHYLALGIRPENIHCVEGSKRVQAEFLENARRLGVRAYPMALEQALKQCVAEGHHFDIVNYDFHNQFSDEHTTLLENTPVAPDAIVVYNRLGKREGKAVQDAIFQYDAGREQHLAQVNSLLSSAGDDAASRGLQRHLRLPGHNDLPHFASETELNAHRFNALMALPKAVIGSSHVRLDRRRLCDAGMIRLGDAGTDELFHSAASQSEICGALAGGMAHYLLVSTKSMAALVSALDARPGRLLRGCDPVPLALVHQHAIFGLNYEVQGSRYIAYRSRTSPDASPAPFLTSLFRSRRPDSVLGQHDPVLRFCSSWIREQARFNFSPDNGSDYARGIFVVLDPRGRIKEANEPVLWNDVIGVVRNRTVLEKVQASALRMALVDAANVVKSGHLVCRV